MHVAALLDEVDIVRYLLSKEAKPNASDRNGETAIYIAAYRGYTEVVRLLVEANADVNCVCTGENWTPLHAAIDYPETVRALLRGGGDINIESKKSETPLDYAIRMGYHETVRVILNESKIKPDLNLRSTRIALQNAVLESHTEVVSLVLGAGGDVNAVDGFKQSLLSLSMQFDHEFLVREILVYRPDLNIKDVNENTALHRITRETPVASVRLVVNSGAELNTMNKNKSTPLMIAIWEGNTEVVKYLLSKVAVTSALNMPSLKKRASPLHIACQHGSLETVELLLHAGSNPNFKCDGQYGTPLISAILRTKNESEREKQQIIQLLLDRGASPTANGGETRFPIISASETCSAEVVKLLLKSGASTDVRDSFGRKPVHLACYNSLEVLNALDIPDSDFAACDYVHRVPLHYAAASGQPKLFEEVLARSKRVNIDINERDKSGWTPLGCAELAKIDNKTWSEAQRKLHCDVITSMKQRGAVPGRLRADHPKARL